MRQTRQLLRKYKIYIFPFVTIFAILLLSLNVLIPKGKDIYALQDALQEKQEDLAKLKKKRLLLESLDREQMLSDLEEAESTLPQEKNVASILLSLENISARTEQGVDSISFTPGLVSTQSAESESNDETSQPVTPIEKEIARKNVSALPVLLRTRGSTNQFREFISLLEKSRRVFDVESVLVTYFPDNEDFLSADFSLFAFFLPPITNIGKLDTPIAELTQTERDLLSKIREYPNLGSFAIENGQPGAAEPIGKSDLFSP